MKAAAVDPARRAELTATAPRTREVVVVGAGIVGVCTAHALREAGLRVTVVEARQEVALETSFANAGRFCPTLLSTYPLSNPSTLKSLVSIKNLKTLVAPSRKGGDEQSQGPGSTSNPDAVALKSTGALPSTTELSLDVIRWGAHFVRGCTQKQTEAKNAIFRRLSHLCQDSTSALIAQFPNRAASVDLRFDNVWVYGSQEALEQGVQRAQKASGAGFKHWNQLSCQACISTFPFLESYFDKMIAQGMEPGCVAVLDDYTANAHKFTAEVRSLCERGPLPVRFHFGQRIRSVSETSAGSRRLRVVLTSSGDAGGVTTSTLEADHVVLCCGPSTNAVQRELGMTALPMVGLRGASIDLHGVEYGPRAGIADYVSGDLGFQLTPLEDGTVRLAGFADLIGDGSTPVTEAQCERYGTALKTRARLLFPHMTWTEESTPWSGVRPMTPDSLPYTGRAPGPLPNIWVNAGHGPVGWTMAAGTARILAHQLATADGLSYAGESDFLRYGLEREAPAFSPSRFLVFGH
ncbi:Hypothetical Protein FCC1311_090542 [Hondaea fermentalgiana]|uniref:FAD dependent oxidoreductase domain-containing protein n=1 Tax=Hondaea fermentalgiana TaxID=2315210 RepID=A0A2R5GR91_9STRA|nr:Hypothetical Protein FCC1311_090542 [Hondaea fermentalgiana]|eukprot:GBG32829.1 Hypothetical Protein FCC1311_090542 [Hondaea fermentalgiana]